MALKNNLLDGVLRRFRRVKVMTIALLMAALRCSRSTAQRRLKEWKCHTSINRNGSCYALPSVVAFDEHGIWRHKGVCFSSHGNLTRTVLAMVTESDAGLSCKELSGILGMKAQSFIWGFVQKGIIVRERLHGAFVYMSPDAELRQRQRHNRLKLGEGRGELTEYDALTVLVEMIKYPTLTPVELAQRLHRRAPTASGKTIERFLTAHDLGVAKKGASNSR